MVAAGVVDAGLVGEASGSGSGGQPEGAGSAPTKASDSRNCWAHGQRVGSRSSMCPDRLTITAARSHFGDFENSGRSLMLSCWPSSLKTSVCIPARGVRLAIAGCDGRRPISDLRRGRPGGSGSGDGVSPRPPGGGISDLSGRSLGSYSDGRWFEPLRHDGANRGRRHRQPRRSTRHQLLVRSTWPTNNWTFT